MSLQRPFRPTSNNRNLDGSNDHKPKNIGKGTSNLSQMVASYCRHAFNSTERAPITGTPDHMIELWLEKTTNTLCDVLPRNLTPRYIPRLLCCARFTLTRDLLVDLVRWSCFSNECHELILESLDNMSSSGPSNVEALANNLSYYILYIKSTLQGICTNIQKSRGALEESSDIVMANKSQIVIQTQYLTFAVERCSVFAAKVGSFDLQTLSSFVDHQVNLMPQPSISSILESCDLTRFIGTKLDHKSPGEDRNIPNTTKSDEKKKLESMKQVLGEIMDVQAMRDLSDCDAGDSEKLLQVTETAAKTLDIDIDSGMLLAITAKFFDQLRNIQCVERYGMKTLVNEIYPILCEGGVTKQLIQDVVHHFKEWMSLEFVLAIQHGSSSYKPFQIPVDEVWTIHAIEASDWSQSFPFEAGASKEAFKKTKQKKLDQKGSVDKKSRKKKSKIDKGSKKGNTKKRGRDHGEADMALRGKKRTARSTRNHEKKNPK